MPSPLTHDPSVHESVAVLAALARTHRGPAPLRPRWDCGRACGAYHDNVFGMDQFALAVSLGVALLLILLGALILRRRAVKDNVRGIVLMVLAALFVVAGGLVAVFILFAAYVGSCGGSPGC